MTAPAKEPAASVSGTRCYFDEVALWTQAVRDRIAATLASLAPLDATPNRYVSTPCRTVRTGLSPSGYARRDIRGRKYRLARLVLALAGQRDDPALVTDHRCRNRACIEPSHLQLITQRENILSGTSPVARNAAKIGCDRGHVFDETNLAVLPNGERRCRACHRYRQRRLRAIQRAGAVGQFSQVAA